MELVRYMWSTYIVHHNIVSSLINVKVSLVLRTICCIFSIRLHYLYVMFKAAGGSYTIIHTQLICGLHPFTNYTFTIVARPNEGGHWSDAITKMGLTDEAGTCAFLSLHCYGISSPVCRYAELSCPVTSKDVQTCCFFLSCYAQICEFLWYPDQHSPVMICHLLCVTCPALYCHYCTV